MIDFNGHLAPGPLEVGFDSAFFIPATVDRVPCVYIKNHRVYGLDPADPIRVSYRTPLREEPIARERPDLVRMPVDSQSLLPVLLGAPGAEARHELVLQGMGNLALRQGDWKYIAANRPPGTPRPTVAKLADTVFTETHLYTLTADPGETNNLAATHPEKVAAMAARLLQLWPPPGAGGN